MNREARRPTSSSSSAQVRQEARWARPGDRRGEGSALNNLGNALRQPGRNEEAITAHQAAVEIYRETGDRHGEGTALNNLGVALRQPGRNEEAITAHRAAVELYRETGDGTARALR